MIDYFNSIFPNTRQALLSLFFCTTGEAIGEFDRVISNNITTGFQHAAWTIGIIAGIVSIMNGIASLRDRRRKERINDKN
jgi:hypothetical protein